MLVFIEDRGMKGKKKNAVSCASCEIFRSRTSVLYGDLRAIFANRFDLPG